MTKKKRIKLALVCTKGGHFEQMTHLSEFYSKYSHFWITNRNQQTEGQLQGENVYFINIAHFKRPWTYLSQLAPLLKIFAKERPTHLLSTGSGRTALLPFILSQILRLKFIYIDTFSRVKGHSKFGTFLLKTKNKIYTQWDDPGDENAIYIGPIFKKQEDQTNNHDAEYVFVTLGTREEPFARLIKGVEELVRKGAINEKVIIQAGYTNYNSDCVEIFDFCNSEKIEELIRNARYVITQESAGIGTQCLKYKTKFIVMPRDYAYGELPTKSDMNEDLHFKLEELGYTAVVSNVSELEKAISNIDIFKTGFNFNNSLAISSLHKIMEEL